MQYIGYVASTQNISNPNETTVAENNRINDLIKSFRDDISMNLKELAESLKKKEFEYYPDGYLNGIWHTRVDERMAYCDGISILESKLEIENAKSFRQETKAHIAKMKPSHQWYFGLTEKELDTFLQKYPTDGSRSKTIPEQIEELYEKVTTDEPLYKTLAKHPIYVRDLECGAVELFILKKFDVDTGEATIWNRTYGYCSQKLNLLVQVSEEEYNAKTKK